MATSVGVGGLLADVVILLALLVAVTRPRVAQVTRPLIATFAFACAWVVTVACDALRAPSWTLVIGAAVLVAITGVIIITVHLWTLEPHDDENPPAPSDEDGGGGPGHRRPDPPRQGDGGTDPHWWPEFERQF